MSKSEAERLEGYYPFDLGIADIVGEVAERQRHSSWASVEGSLPDTKIFRDIGGSALSSKAIEVIDFIPDDYLGAQMHHLPMGNTLDKNMLMRLATLSAVQPDMRIIGVGNPGSPGRGHGKLSTQQSLQVWSGDTRPLVDLPLRYLKAQGIEEVEHFGYSYGADKAAGAAKYSSQYDQRVTRGIFMEPAAVRMRGIIELSVAFNSTAAALDGYVQAANCGAYDEARKQAAKQSFGLTGYSLGLLRPTNIAISHVLSQDGFENRVSEALDSQDTMTTSIVWGTESELAIDETMQAISGSLAMRFEDRVKALPIQGQRHAMGDDIYLLAALMLQARVNAS